MMKIRLKGHHNNVYYIITSFISYKHPFSIRFDIASWEKYTEGTLSKCKWNSDDGDGFHQSTICSRFYKSGKMEWCSDDGKGKPGLPLSVMDDIEKLCNRLLKLKLFL